MMKRIIPVLTFVVINAFFIFFFPSKIFTQTDFPFPFEKAVWSELQLQLNPNQQFLTVHYGIVGDTIIGGSEYKKLYISRDSIYDFSDLNSLTFSRGIRLDSNKVYITNSPGSSSSQLIYDSSMEVNDTLFDGGIEFATIGTLIVQSIDSVFLNDGTQRKRWNFESITSSVIDSVTREEISRTFAFFWIEGIGNTKCPFKSPVDCAFKTSPMNRLLCFEQNQQNIYQDINYPDCYFSTIVSTDTPIPNLDIQISPNPTQGPIEITSFNMNEMNKYRLILIDASGKIVLQKLIILDGLFRVDISEFASGVYTFCYTIINQ